VTDNSVTPIQKICDTVEITVRPTIIPTISILRTLTSVDNCVGDLAEFTATASAGTITWSNGSTGTTGTYTDWNNNDQVIATITNNDACAIPKSVTSNTIVLNGTAKQDIDLEAAIPALIDGTFCFGKEVDLVAVAGSDLVKYQWLAADRSMLSSDASYSFSATESTTLVLKTTAPAGCYTNAGTSKERTINIEVEAPITITNLGYTDDSLDLQSICVGNKGIFTVMGTASQYKWFVNGTEDAALVDATVSIANLQNGDSVRVEAQSLAGCPVRAKASIAVVVDKMPRKGLVTGTEPVYHCAGKDTVARTTETQKYTYTWKSGNTVLSTDSILKTRSESKGTVTIQNGACVVNFPFEVRETAFGIKLNASPAENFEPGEALDLSTSVSGNKYDRNIVYQWSPTAILATPNAANTKANPTETVFVKVMATSPEGCMAKDSLELKKRNKLFIPNALTPESGDQNAAWNISGTENYPDLDIKVFNRWGVLVHSQTGYTAPWDGNLNGKPLPAGTYYFVIKHRTLDKPLVGDLTIVR
jgi:gliding motility-associated-like protein